MCVMSMVMDHYFDKWSQPSGWTWPYTPAPAIYQPPTIAPEEVAEFKRLLERAREYDRKNNEPDCELEEKRKKVKELAAALGVEIDFL